jgi:hypothetical protein
MKQTLKLYMHYDDLEGMVQEGKYLYKSSSNMLFDNNENMFEHLELTFTDGKLTNVEMKDATN